MPQFLDPGALWWLAAAVPAITIMYFLKLRRQERVVSSTLLWRRSVYDMRVNSPIQMIRRNILLLLQLLIIIFLIIALARPFTKLTHSQGLRAALIIDVSASMGTRDEEGGKTRLEAAREEALRIVDKLGVGNSSASDELCVILAADRPIPLCGLTSDKNVLRRAIENIGEPRNTVTNMEQALNMAIGVTYVAKNIKELESGEEIGRAAKPLDELEDQIGLSNNNLQMQARVIILSDGSFPEVSQSLADKIAGPAEDGDDRIGAGSEFIPFGKTESDNLGIVAVDLRADPLTDGRQLFVRLENMSGDVKTAAVEINLLNGGKKEFIDRKSDIKVSPRSAGDSGDVDSPGQAGVVFDIPEDISGGVEVKIDGNDSLAADDSAFIVISRSEPVRALLVSPQSDSRGSYFLEVALGVDKKNVEFEVISSANYPKAGAPKDAKGRPYEIVIFDRFAPEETPPGASFFIGAAPKLPGIRLAEKVPVLYAPMVVDWKRSHPTMENLSLLDRLSILKCLRLEISGLWKTVVDGQGLALASVKDLSDQAKVEAAEEYQASMFACLVSEERRVAVLAFDIWETERWPWRVSFPLFIRNTVHWLSRPGGMQHAAVMRTGQTLRAEFADDVDGVKVVTPSGEAFKPSMSGARKVYFSRTQDTGFYRVVAGEEERLFGYSLVSGLESDNSARDSIKLGRDSLSAKATTARRNIDLWPYVAMLALVILMAEWYVYNRRILG